MAMFEEHPSAFPQATGNNSAFGLLLEAAAAGQRYVLWSDGSTADPAPALHGAADARYAEASNIVAAPDYYADMELDFGASSNLTNGTNFTSAIPDSLTNINMTQLIAYSLLFPFAAIGNLMVFVALFRSRHRKSRVNMMIMHLSLADMIVTFVFLPTEITWHVTIEWVFGNFGCKIYKFFSAFGFYMSSMVLVCISLDRYFAVLHPLKVNDAQRRGKIMLFFAWLISAVISLPQSVIFNVQPHPEYPDFYQCVTFGFFNSNNGGEMMYTIFCISFLYFIPLTIIIIAYTRIILEISRKSRDTQHDYTREERYHGRLQLRRSNMSNIERARTRTLRMTFIIVMAFIWCWTPYALATLWNFIDPVTFHNMNKHVQDILFIIAVSNSVVNPFIYGRYSISCCRGLWNTTGDLCCYWCCPCTPRKNHVPPQPPNVNSCKSNGHFNASAHTRSTIYNNSTRDRMVVGVRIQDSCCRETYKALSPDGDSVTQNFNSIASEGVANQFGENEASRPHIPVDSEIGLSSQGHGRAGEVEAKKTVDTQSLSKVKDGRRAAYATEPHSLERSIEVEGDATAGQTSDMPDVDEHSALLSQSPKPSVIGGKDAESAYGMEPKLAAVVNAP
ncbi:gonadotropin-releasing hormone receptor-like isoform X2 [Penaeus japonicus]|uniref:gonadotropin-releasing hormone receptor-like isoform X2 n=1 Tax=Penaeus japonicus TaxID=27405 RepID=UPI001C70B7A8|nr:gonadotropin-releasing hormone receptor-like isoform X2 [Penaeus japonicus]